jgi:predicted secreted protein
MQWNQTYSGGTWNTLWGVIQRSDGGYALVGVKDWLRVWLIKADSNGTLLWEKTYEGSGDEEPRDLVQTFDGGYAIAGYTTSYGAGGSDGWLVKTDADGNVQWNMTYGGPNRDEFGGVVQTADGGFVLTGLTESYSPSTGDAMLVKTDSKGSLEWSRTYGGSSLDFMRHLVLDNDGGVAMIGETQSFGAGDRDIWVIGTCLETGLEQVTASLNAMTLYRGPTDPYWNYVRVQIWLRRTP